MLAALNTKEAHSKQNKDKYNFNKKSNWDAKYIPNFRIMKLIGTRQLEVSEPTGRLRKVNLCDVHKVL